MTGDPATDTIDTLERERDEFRRAALELNAAIRGGLEWIRMDAEPSVAYASMEKVCAKWLPLLEASDD